MSDPATRDAVAGRVLDAPPQEMWRAWSEPDAVARWWGARRLHRPRRRPLPGAPALTVTGHGYLTDEARDLSLAGLEQCLDTMAAMFPARPAG